MKRTIPSLILAGVLPLALLSLAACSGGTSTQDSAQSPDVSSASSPDAAQSNPSPSGQSDMAQMDHGSMNHGSMDHGSMQMPDSSATPMEHGADSTMSMDLGPADENFDLRFIDAMTLHHQGAIEMSKAALEKSSRQEIKTLAQNIINAQETEIAELKQWRQAWYSNAGSQPMMYHAEMNGMMPMTAEVKSSMMMTGDLGAADDQFDLRFINAMIPHHEGAIVMAEEALKKSSRPEVLELAQSIIDAQQPEIDQMKQWRQAWYSQ